MKCKFVECAYAEECVILDIIKKEPKNFSSCSYSKKQKDPDTEKKEKK
jgi:hypothetical protein